MTVDSTGLTIKTYAEIRAELIASYQGVFGPQVQLGPDTPDGQWIAILADREAALWSLLQVLYDALDRESAGGAQLDNLAALVGLQREAARASTAVLTASGTSSTVVPAGTIFKVPGGARFTSDAEVTLDGGGAGSIAVTAEETGAITASVGTITEIVTPVSGLDTVTNAAAATVGRAIETDQQLRARIEVSLQPGGEATVQAIRAALLALEIVDQCVVLSNRTDAVDADGLPAKSFRAIVWPDPGTAPDDDDVFAAIWSVAPAGIYSDGVRSGTVTDSQGYAQTLRYSVASELSTYITATLTTTSAYPADGDDQVEAAILLEVNGDPDADPPVEPLQIGDDLLLYRIVGAIDALGLAGITNIVVTAKVGSAPGGGDVSNITASATEVITTDAAQVTVVS